MVSRIRGVVVAPSGTFRLVNRALVAALVAATMLYIGILLSGTAGSVWVDALTYSLPAILAAALALLQYRKGSRRAGPWLLLCLALLTDAVASIAYAVMPADASSLTALIPDAIWLAFYPLALAFIVQLSRRQLLLMVPHGWLDAFIIALAIVTVAGASISSAIGGIDLTDRDTLVSGLYVIGDLALLTAVIVVALAFRLAMPLTWWLIVSAFLLYAIADATYFVLMARTDYTEGTLLDALWPISALLLGLAAATNRRYADPIRREFVVPTLVPGLAMLVTAVVLVVMPFGPAHVLVSVIGFVVIVLGVVRMTVAMRESESMNEQLSRAELDTLTGLPNMRALRSLTSSQVRGSSLIILDISDFADINIMLGHDAGDRLLVEIGSRLSERLRRGDVLFRLGSDGFAVLLPSTDANGATIAAEGFIAVLERPMSVDGIPLHVTACGGVATHDPTSTADSMFREADDALSRAKKDGPGLVRSAESGSGGRSADRLLRRAAINDSFAAGGDDFVVYYQPIVDLKDNSLFATEALVRWRHEGSVLAPGAFMDDLVQVGAMEKLTRHMLTTALRELRANGLPYPVAVNVSPELIADDLVDLVEESLRKSGSTPEQLLIEVTEESLMQFPQQAALVLGRLREIGVKVELDDFGTGWSGLSSLRDLVVDGIKIDRSFVARVMSDDAARAIIDGVSIVAQELDLMTIFEGIEDEALADFLRARYPGCIQGFGVARPMPIADLVRWTELRQPPGN